MDHTLQINWFPGHMKRAQDEITARLKDVDLIIEVLDARAPVTTSNPIVAKMGKPLLQIALKDDLSPLPPGYQGGILVGSLKDGGGTFRKQIIKAMDVQMASKIAKLQAKGLKQPKFLVLVLGLPNLGKSSLINFLKQRKQLNVENRPGVTKHQTIVTINDRYSLIDTPGVLFKKIDDQTDGFKLVLVGAIKKEVVPLDAVLAFAFQQLGGECLASYYHLPSVPPDYPTFQAWLCHQRGFVLPNGDLDHHRFLDCFFKDVTTGQLTKVNWDPLKTI